MSSFHFRIAEIPTEIKTPKLLTLLHAGSSLSFFTTGEKFDQVKPNAYSPRNLTLKQLSFSPSTIIHIGEFSSVWDVFDGQEGGGEVWKNIFCQ